MPVKLRKCEQLAYIADRVFRSDVLVQLHGRGDGVMEIEEHKIGDKLKG